MCKKFFFSLIGMIASFVVFAQQDAQFSQYFFNPLYINPGYAGSREVLSGTLTYRNQWVAMPGKPETEALSIHTPFRKKQVGLAFMLYHDQIGPVNNMGISATYAYWIPVGTYKLAFGLQGMLQQIRVDWDAVTTKQSGDKSFIDNPSSTLVPDANFGIYLHKERFYIGASVTHLVENKFHIGDSFNGEEAKFYRHFYFLTGGVIKLGEETNFRPSILVKMVSSFPIEYELNGSFIFFNKLFLGGGYRTSQSFGSTKSANQLIGILEYNFNNKYRIGYSYDIGVNKIDYNSGTHELMLGIDLNFDKEKIFSPRYF